MTATIVAAPSLASIAPSLSESHVRSVDTFNALTEQVSRRNRRSFARDHKLDTASPARWPHDLRMLACKEFGIAPVLGVGGRKHVFETYGIDVDAEEDETPAEREAAIAAVESDPLDAADIEEEPDPFGDLDDDPPTPSVFIVPTPDPHFHVTDDVKNLLRTVEKISRKRPVNVALRGPTGCGKTSLPEWYAHKTNRPFFIFDTPTIRETVDAFGQRTIEYDAEGRQRITMKLSGLLQAIQTPRACIVIDEATRAHGSILNGLLALLDHRKRVWLDALGANVHVAPGVVIFVTANIGAQYTGTWVWDAAFENRMDFQLDVGYLKKDAEIEVCVRKAGVDARVARAFVEIANVTRQRLDDPKEPLPHAISTRQLLRASEAVVEGLSPLKALEYTVIPTYSADGGESSDRAHVLQIIQGKLAA